ncbi:MAG: 50S ribosomal protein L32 [Planctomycetes bacterium]|nr:50S ribosomal protein L32 [Planctomycetota bacterium]
MGVPKRKTSKARRGQRRSHLALPSACLGRCPKCNQAVRPHHVCGNCGHYRGP